MIGICLGGFSVKPAILFCEGWTYHLRSEKNRCEKHTPFPYPFLPISAFFKKKKFFIQITNYSHSPYFPRLRFTFFNRIVPNSWNQECGYHDKFREIQG